MSKIALLVFILGCGSTTTSDAGTDSSTDANVQETSTNDAAKDAAGGDSGTCAPPQGTACPPTAGNCKNIGDPCTKGGNQCPSPTACDLDLGPGVGICITIFACAPNHGDCGKGATCCNTAMTSNTPVCLPNLCLPTDCTAEP